MQWMLSCSLYHNTPAEKLHSTNSKVCCTEGHLYVVVGVADS